MGGRQYTERVRENENETYNFHQTYHNFLQEEYTTSLSQRPTREKSGNLEKSVVFCFKRQLSPKRKFFYEVFFFNSNNILEDIASLWKYKTSGSFFVSSDSFLQDKQKVMLLFSNLHHKTSRHCFNNCFEITLKFLQTYSDCIFPLREKEKAIWWLMKVTRF